MRMGRGEVGRRGVKLWTILGLFVLLVVPELARVSADTGVDAIADVEDDDWEDFDDDEMSQEGIASSKGKASALKALPQLTDQNAERILNSTEYVLLLGYASWCKQSAVVMVDFAEAAAVLAKKGSPVVLAKVDAIANKITAKRYKIKGYPTIIFITNGTGETYTGGQTREDIFNWVQKRSGHPATTFTSIAEAEELQSRKETVVVGLFEKFEGTEYEEFIAASKEAADVEFLQTTNLEAAKAFNVDFGDTGPTIGIWKSEPENFIKFGGKLEIADILPFVALNKYNLITKLQARNMGKIYGSPVKKQVMIFANSEDYESLYPLFLDSAKQFKSELLFLWVDMDDEHFSRPLAAMYGILGSEPTVAGFDNTNGSRYLLESQVNIENLKEFASGFKEGRLLLHYKSEPIPKKSKGDVKIVVGKTFEKLVLKSSRDVLLLVYTPYCYDCESINKTFIKLAKHFRGLSSIVFAKIDASVNEHRKLTVDSYPAVLLYQASAKDSLPVEAPPKSSLKKLVQFVNEYHLKSIPGSEKCNDECKSHLDSEVPRRADEDSSGEPQKVEGIAVELTPVREYVPKEESTNSESEDELSFTTPVEVQPSQTLKTSLDHDEL